MDPPTPLPTTTTSIPSITPTPPPKRTARNIFIYIEIAFRFITDTENGKHFTLYLQKDIFANN